MSRSLRIEYPGAWYHVMNRGLSYQDIYLVDDHRQMFIDALAEALSLIKAECHAYCLMDNHYHLLLYTPMGNLNRVMRHLNGVYTQRFNRNVKRDGPLFRGRYKAILIDADAYLLQVSRYIHRNPLEAGLVKHLEQYRWSSYKAYVGKNVVPIWLHDQKILNMIGQRNQSSKNSGQDCCFIYKIGSMGSVSIDALKTVIFTFSLANNYIIK